MISPVSDYEKPHVQIFMAPLSLPKSSPDRATVRDLPIHNCTCDSTVLVRDLTEQFNRTSDLPGIILESQAAYIGMISRDLCFEALGRPFGIEIFSKKTALEFFQYIGSIPLILDEMTSVQDAVKVALTRTGRETYAPLVIRMIDGSHGVLDMHTLLTAQSELLESLYMDVQQLSLRDPLTNVYNRRGFFEIALDKINSSENHNNELSAFMLDIDYFKMVNDVYGHYVGDMVLRAIADEIEKSLRSSDISGRYGGEEFVVLLPETNAESAARVAERIRHRIENLAVFVEGFQVSVTVSVGVSQLSHAGGSLETLLNQTDEAMYIAKWRGRNQVVQWNPGLTHQVPLGKNNQKPEESRFQKGHHENHDMDPNRVYDETIEGWAHALELRDKETEGHAKRVTDLAIDLSRKIGIPEEELVQVRRGALLHDIGKIAIPDGILFKPGPLTEEEWMVMRKHPVYAYELLSPISFLQKAIDIPYCHHEHWDGTGYPRGLHGKEIPLAARIFTIIDVWDALSTDRCYRLAWPPELVADYLQSESGKIFDPDIVIAFFEMMKDKAFPKTSEIISN